MATSQKFGGNWTEEKLNIFTSYLDAYLIALQNQKFKKIYIDAFAGTGEIETSDGGQYLVGSAKRALASEKKFDHYYFIEADSQCQTANCGRRKRRDLFGCSAPRPHGQICERTLLTA